MKQKRKKSKLRGGVARSVWVIAGWISLRKGHLSRLEVYI